jgi:activator of 2-hydroxyglutaryl-CoA dehydratase
MGRFSLKSAAPVQLSTGCAVFMETEAVSRVAEGYAKEDIIAGLHQALADRLWALAQRTRLEIPCALTGGGARDEGLVKALEKKLGQPLLLPDEPLITAAIGAALIVAERKA